MFYLFNQNNSGGSFIVNDKVCHRLFIEADDGREALRILKVINMVIFVHMLALSHSRPLKNMRNIWQTHMDGLRLTHEFFIKMEI
nr:MAG TPA: hypothetical protein [Caudoviricetes sp.]